MVDTLRTWSALQTILADNATGDISPQDVRDLLATLAMNHGQITEVGNAAATVISDTTSFFEVTLTAPATSAISAFQGSADFDQPADGRLRYLGTPTRMFHVMGTVSFTAASNNQEIHMQMGKSGSPSAEAEIRRKIATGVDVGSTAIHWITSLATNEYLSVFAKNVTTASNITVVSINIQAMGMIM